MSLFGNASNIWFNGQTGSLAYLNGNLLWSSSFTQSVSPSGDLIRAALRTAYTTSYDAAETGNFILVDSASYLAVQSQLSPTIYGMNETTMSGPNGTGTSWGSPFIFNFYQSGQISSSNYIIGFSTIFNSTGAQTASIYFGTGSNASGSTANIVGNVLMFSIAGSVPTSGSRQYFIRKAPNDPLSANAWMYLWSRNSLKIKGGLVNPVQYKNIGNNALTTITAGSYSNWTTAGAPAHQFLGTTTKSW